MPPTTLIAAEIDPLLSGGQKLAEKLQAAGVPVVYEEYPGVTHEFFGMGAVLKQSKDAVSLVANNLQKAFKKD
jgi:acetyl esterase/lipase